MTEIVPVPDGDRQRMTEITEYLNGELAQRDDGAAPVVHVHYHAAPVAPAAPPAVPTAGQAALDRAVPYFVMLLGGLIIVGGLAAVVVMMIPALLALAVTCAFVMGGGAILFTAVAAAVRSLRQSKTEQQVSARLLKEAGRRRR
jgi:hypothetical protein